MNHANNSKVSIFEKSVHNPHNIWQDASLCIKIGHQKWNIRCTLMVNYHKCSFISTFGNIVTSFYNYEIITFNQLRSLKNVFVFIYCHSQLCMTIMQQWPRANGKTTPRFYNRPWSLCTLMVSILSSI